MSDTKQNEIGSFEKKLQQRWYVHLVQLRKEEEITKLKIDKNTNTIIENRNELWNLIEESTHILRYNDIPWLSIYNKELLLLELNISKDKNGNYNKKHLYKAMLRWHPDSFTRKFGMRLCEKDFTIIMDRITETFQAILAAVNK
jgi:hypothetical protein